MNKRTEISLALLAVGGALIAVVQSESLIVKVIKDVPPMFYTATFLAGATMTGMAFLNALAGILSVARHQVGEVEYSCEAISYGDIEGFLEFIQQFFGDDELPSLERVQDWQAKNKNIMYYVKRSRRILFWSITKAVGCFGVLPVNQETASRLAENSLVGRELHSDNIVAPSETPAAYYIGVLAAKGFQNKKETLLALLGNINAKLETHKVPVFTRPITKDGERLVAKYKFVPVVANYSRAKDVIFKRE